MSTVDLSKLIARKNFFIPVKSSDINKAVLDQLKLDDRSWGISVERLTSGTFEIVWRNAWVDVAIVEEGLPLTESNRKKKLAEFLKDPFKHYNQVVGSWLGHLPYNLHFVVMEENTNGCVCEVTCFPTLYLKIVRNLAVECSQADLQNARLQCEEFLVDIFVGGLRGKEIIERREVSRWELLINDVDCHHVTERINQMFKEATGEVLLMGWVGTDCLPELRELTNKGVTIQAVAHKPSEMKSPVPKDIQQGFTGLIKIVGKTNVSTNRELHGRAIIVDNKALIGSMDLNSHSLSGEHREFAVYTEDVDTVRKIRTYFKKIFTPLEQAK